MQDRQNMQAARFDKLANSSAGDIKALIDDFTAARLSLHKSMATELAAITNNDSALVHEHMADAVMPGWTGQGRPLDSDNVLLPYLPAHQDNPWHETPVHLLDGLCSRQAGLFDVMTGLAGHLRNSDARSLAEQTAMTWWDDLVRIRGCRLRANQAQSWYRQQLGWWPSSLFVENVGEFQVVMEAAEASAAQYLITILKTRQDPFTPSMCQVLGIVAENLGKSGNDQVQVTETDAMGAVDLLSVIRYLNQLGMLALAVMGATTNGDIYQAASHKQMVYNGYMQDIVNSISG